MTLSKHYNPNEINFLSTDAMLSSSSSINEPIVETTVDKPDVPLEGSKHRPPKLILTSLEAKAPSQQTISLPVTPNSAYSTNLSFYGRPSSNSQTDLTHSSFASSPTLTRSSCRFILASEFILGDTCPSVQRKGLETLQVSANKFALSPELCRRTGKDSKPKKNRLKMEGAYPKLITQKKPKQYSTFTPEGLIHRILLKLRDLQLEEAFQFALALTDDKLKLSSLQPHILAVIRASILASCESIPVLFFDRGFSLDPNSSFYPPTPGQQFQLPSFFMMACALSLNKVVSAIVKNANVNQTWMGVTPLMYASALGNSSLVQLLMDFYADPNYYIDFKHFLTWRKTLNATTTPTLFSDTSNRTSVGSNSKSGGSFSSSLKEDSSLQNSKVTALVLASGSQNISCVQIIASSMTPSALAGDKLSLVVQQNSQVSLYLLRCGINPSQKDGLENDLLHNAAISGRLDLVEIYLQFGADINATGIRDCTALHLAVKFRHPRIALVLTCYGADRSLRNSDGLTAEELGFQSGLDSETISAYFDTSNVSSQKINTFFADPLAPVKSRKPSLFNTSFLRKWVTSKKSLKDINSHALGHHARSVSFGSSVSSLPLPGTMPSRINRSFSTDSSTVLKNNASTESRSPNSLRDKFVNLVTKPR